MISVDPIFDWYTILLLIGLVQGYFIAYFFLTHSRRKPANRYLGLLILVLSLSLTETFLNYTGLMLRVLPLSNFSEPLQLLIGPLIFLYFRARNGRPFRTVDYLHFLPMVLFGAYMFFEFSLPLEHKYNRYIDIYFPALPFLATDSSPSADPWHIRSFITTRGMYLQLGSYLLFSAFTLRNIVRKWGQGLPPLQREAQRRRWLRNLGVIFLLGFLLFLLVKNHLGQVQGDNILGIYITFFFYIVGYSLIRNSTFLEPRGTNKYETSSLSTEFMTAKTQQLQRVMAEEKPFLDNQFSLADLARLLALSEHHVSQIINEQLGTNFFGLLNYHRTQEARDRLDDPANDHLKIEQIAYDVGYNSKSTFYSAFKKAFGQTPHAYRKGKSEGSPPQPLPG